MSQKTESVYMNDDQWLSKLGGVAATGVPANANVPPYQPQVAIPVYQPPEFRTPQPEAPHYETAQQFVPQPDLPPFERPVPVQEYQPQQVEAEPEQEPAPMHPPQAAPVARAVRKMLNTEMPSLGVLDQFLRDETVGDILVNGTHSIYIDKHEKMIDSGERFVTHEEVWEVAERIVKSVGQTISTDRPMIDTRLPDGSRVNIIAPPMSVDGVSLSIRKFPSRQITLNSMIGADQMTPELAKFLSECVRTRLNIIISGGTGSGKTTLLNALSSAIGSDERIVTIEDSAELKLQQPHVVRLESKVVTDPSAAHQEVSIRDLVRNALRMRPDRIIVGESRGGEALDMLQAMNTGHDGSMTTLHSNTPRDALSRLETMVSVAMPQLPMRLVRQQVASSVNLIINMARCKDGVRRVMAVSEISGMEGEVVIMQDLVNYTESTTDRQGHYRWTSGAPRNQLVTDAARAAGMIRTLR